MKQDNDEVEFNVVQGSATEPTSAVTESAVIADTNAPDNVTAEQTQVRDDDNVAVQETDRESLPRIEKAIEDIAEENVEEADVQPASSFSLSKALGGAILARFIQQQILLVLLIVVFLIIYITARYWCQQDMVQIDQKEKELVSIHYKATVFTSKMTEQSRQSNIMELLGRRGDSTLEIPTVPPYKIYIPE